MLSTWAHKVPTIGLTVFSNVSGTIYAEIGVIALLTWVTPSTLAGPESLPVEHSAQFLR